MRKADKVMQLLDNHRHVCLASSGCGSYHAASIHLKPVWRRTKAGMLKRVGVEPVDECEAEGATPSEALHNLTELVKRRAAQDRQALLRRRKQRRKS